MKKILYILCKTINWALPFFLIANGAGNKINGGFLNHVITISYGIFAVMWFFYHSTSSRWLYQSFFFGGYIIGLYNIFTDHNTVFENMFHTTSIYMNIGDKLILVAVCIIAFTSKIYTLIYETKKYNAGSTERHNNYLDEKVYQATYDLEHAKTLEEKHRAEARLERAKLSREKYKIDDE